MPVRDSLRLFAFALGIIALAFLIFYISQKLEPQWTWLQGVSQTHWRVLFGMFITIFLPYCSFYVS
jgi:hypothetical protein